MCSIRISRQILISHIIKIFKLSKQFHKKSSFERKETDNAISNGFLPTYSTRRQSFSREVFVDQGNFNNDIAIIRAH